MEVLGRSTRIAIAAGLAVGIVTLDIALPAQHLAYAFVVPLILIARAIGLRGAIACAVVAALGIEALELVSTHTPLSFLGVLAITLHCAVWVTVIVVFERYESVLTRSYRTASERLVNENANTMQRLARELPAAVRAEEAIAREREFAAIAEAIPQLVWRAGADGVAEYFNAAWLEYTGVDHARLRDSGIEGVIHPIDLQTARDRWDESLAACAGFECQYRLRRADGSYRWFLARATPLRDGAGELSRWFGTCTDIEEQKRTQVQLERRFEVVHRVSETLQEASLPTRLPSMRGVTFSATYRAGSREASIGGDWYDAMRLVDGRLIVSIGDVLGSGLTAAIAMIAMRQAMRGAAQLHADPVAILEAADRTLREHNPDSIVTAFVGVYDPVTRAFAYAGAGHPPPLLRRCGGEIVELMAPGLPLGVRRKGDTEAREIEIESGSFLTLYTDGLIEATRDLSVGERRLRETLTNFDTSRPGRAAERIASTILRDAASDDVAILTLAFTAPTFAEDGIGERRWTFDVTDAFAARTSQRAFCGALVAVGANDAQVMEAELVFAELVGNVVRHAPGPCVVALDTSGAAPVLSVLDRGPGFVQAARLPIDPLSESRRGLFIVHALTFEFAACVRAGGGTHVRAVLTENGSIFSKPSLVKLAEAM